MNLPEWARSLGWHIARAAFWAVLIGTAAALLLLFIWTTAAALTGYGSWWPPVAILALAVVAGGVTTWRRAEMARPARVVATPSYELRFDGGLDDAAVERFAAALKDAKRAGMGRPS